MGLLYLLQLSTDGTRAVISEPDEMLSIFMSLVAGIVVIATCYGLDGPGFKPRWRARFSLPVLTGSEAHSASCTMGAGSPGG